MTAATGSPVCTTQGDVLINRHTESSTASTAHPLLLLLILLLHIVIIIIHGYTEKYVRACAYVLHACEQLTGRFFPFSLYSIFRPLFRTHFSKNKTHDLPRTAYIRRI